MIERESTIIIHKDGRRWAPVRDKQRQEGKGRREEDRTVSEMYLDICLSGNSLVMWWNMVKCDTWKERKKLLWAENVWTDTKWTRANPGVFTRENCRQREQPVQSSKENKASVQRTGKRVWTENNGWRRQAKEDTGEVGGVSPPPPPRESPWVYWLPGNVVVTNEELWSSEFLLYLFTKVALAAVFIVALYGKYEWGQ